MRPSYRFLTVAALVLFLAALTVPAHAQSSFLRNSSISVAGFGQFTPTVTGNGITDRPTRSAGAQAAFRHSYHWWLGFEGSYNYTRFTEYYSTQSRPVQHNVHEFAASYLVNGLNVPILGIRPFALVGVSALFFSPSLNGGQNASWQGEPALNFGVGIDHALLNQHFGIRLEYRGVYAKAPDFHKAIYDTGASRLTSEPLAGVYVRF